MHTCPKCQKRLISHASARCNWCGQVIDDPDYQAKAAANRDIYRAQQQMHDLRMLAWQRAVMPIDPVPGAMTITSPNMTARLSMASARRAVQRAQEMEAEGEGAYPQPPP